MVNPTEQINNAMENIACQVPLQCIDKCKYKKYPKLPRKGYEVDETKHLQELDPDWSNFLQAQADSSAKYLYSMNFYGQANDPTLVRNDPLFPAELVHQRLIHLPIVGPLNHNDMFYMLSFILNLTMICPPGQMQIMEYLQQLNLLDNETLTYMQIICRHPNTGLTDEQKAHFQYMTQELINRRSINECSVDNYFNPNHLFQKTSFQIDPYELAHLRYIMEIKKALTKPQYLYLTKFVEHLQEMSTERRDKYLCLFYNMKIIPMCQFSTLLSYLHYKSLPYDTERLKILFKSLENLLNIEESLPQPIVEKAPKPPSKPFQMEFNALKIRNALMELMKGGIPNIVRLTDLRIFIKDILLLRPNDLEILFNTLKTSINVKQLQFLKKYIKDGKIAGPPNRLKLITETIDKIINESGHGSEEAQQAQSQPQQGATSENTATVKNQRSDNLNTNPSADTKSKKRSSKQNTSKTGKIDIKSILTEVLTDNKVNIKFLLKKAPAVHDNINEKDTHTHNLVDDLDVTNVKKQFKEIPENEERELGGAERHSYSRSPSFSKSKHRNSDKVHKFEEPRSRSSHDDILSATSKLAFRSKPKLPIPSEESEQSEYKAPKIDYFIYPPPRRHGPANEYLIDSPRGPIPLINNRALWFHIPMRDKKMNKIVFIKDGVLNLK